MADFIAPKDAGVKDYLGGFIVTAGEQVEQFSAEFAAAGDDYSSIMVKALGDRFAEALAELMHLRMRRDWGFGREETLTIDELIKERYRSVRPAPGYPACPDHTEKWTIFRLLDAERSLGVSLTENLAMTPASSVSGFYFAHPAARYFRVSQIARDQVEDYVRRKDMSVSEIEKWLRPNLGYD